MSKESFEFPKVLEHDDYVESWYPIISDLTFKTWIFKFSLEEGILLHRIVRSTFRHEEITESDQASLDTFLSKVTNFFEKVKSESPENSGYFLRLGSRSLKDAVFYSKNALKRFKDLLYDKYLDEYKSLQLETREDKINWVNQKSQMKDLYNISECDIKALKCNNISDMFELFFNSERILVDLGREIKMTSPNFSLNFRLWDDRLDYQNEFRGFVYHHKFCALTQYDDRLYYDHVYKNKELILKSITDLYENKVRPNMQSNCPLAEGSYIIDFGIIFLDKDNVEAFVIEINRFEKTTGPSLFSWEKDIETLTGQKDFEFRLIKENQYSNVDYEHIIYPDFISLKNQVKAKVVNDNKTFIERYLTWRNDVVPQKLD